MQNIMHNYANRLESGGAIDHLPASEASPSATFWRAKRAQCCNATASVASMSLVMKLKRFNFFLKIFKILPQDIPRELKECTNIVNFKGMLKTYLFNLSCYEL